MLEATRGADRRRGEGYFLEGERGERGFVTLVAVGGANASYPLLPPCGNCRQMLWDYAPEATVLLDQEGALIKVAIGELLPLAFRNFYEP